MPGPKKRQSGDAVNAPLYHLRVSLEGIEPAIWRRLQVPGHASLGWLHGVLQVAMGWTNSHMHQFIVGERLYADPRHQIDEDLSVLDETVATVMEVAPRVKDAFLYEYDFGDSWEHRILVEQILDPDPTGSTAAHCLDGARACPPDDCGGTPGYANLLEIIMDPKHDEYEDMMDWLGGKFEPEAFNRERINTCLRKLKWPRITESQLAGVLMRRDGVNA